MKRKSFSVFFWIFVVLAVIFLFFFMRRNVEGFKICTGPNDYNSCRKEPYCPGYQKNGQRKIQYCTRKTATGYECGC